MNLHYVKDIHWLNQVEIETLVRKTKKHMFDNDVEAEMTHNQVHINVFKVTTE